MYKEKGRDFLEALIVTLLLVMMITRKEVSDETLVSTVDTLCSGDRQKEYVYGILSLYQDIA